MSALKDAGILTDEEFQEKKKSLLTKIIALRLLLSFLRKTIW